MKKQLIAIGSLLALLFVAGGLTAVIQGLEIIGHVFEHIFPIFAPGFKQAFSEYLTSVYFIVGVILLVFSSLGIYLNAKEKKILYLIVSIVVDVLSAISLISNLANCS